MGVVGTVSVGGGNAHQYHRRSHQQLLSCRLKLERYFRQYFAFKDGFYLVVATNHPNPNHQQMGWLVGNGHQNADGRINSCSLASNLRDESGVEETPIMLRLKHGFYLVVPDAV